MPQRKGPVQQLGKWDWVEEIVNKSKKGKIGDKENLEASLPQKSRAVIFRSCWTLAVPLNLVGV